MICENCGHETVERTTNIAKGRIPHAKNLKLDNYLRCVREYFEEVPEDHWREYSKICDKGLDGELYMAKNWLLENAEDINKRRTQLKRYTNKWLRRNITDSDAPVMRFDVTA